MSFMRISRDTLSKIILGTTATYAVGMCVYNNTKHNNTKTGFRFYKTTEPEPLDLPPYVPLNIPQKKSANIPSRT